MPRTASRAELQFDEDLARGLRRVRLSVGLEMREAGQAAGLDLTSIWRFENGRINPRLSTLQTLMRLYKANLNIGPDGLMLTWLEEPGENDSQVQTKGGK